MIKLAVEWRSIIGYGCCYEISNDGYVRNVKTGKVLKNRNIGGYHAVWLSYDGIVKSRYVHQLVMEAFGLPKPSLKHEVNHKNGVKSENQINNLEWVTSSENTRHAFEIGLCRNVGENHYCAKLDPAKVRLARKMYADGESCDNIGEKLGVSRHAISKVVTGKTWRSVE